MNENLSKGQQAEALTAAFLEKRGDRILARHYVCRGGELDLVAEHEGCLCFIEVKYRSSQAFGSPEEALSPQKIRSLSRAAASYLRENGGADGSLSFDVAALSGPNMEHFRYYSNAFTPIGLF